MTTKIKGKKVRVNRVKNYFDKYGVGKSGPCFSTPQDLKTICRQIHKKKDKINNILLDAYKLFEEKDELKSLPNSGPWSVFGELLNRTLGAIERLVISKSSIVEFENYFELIECELRKIKESRLVLESLSCEEFSKEIHFLEYVEFLLRKKVPKVDADNVYRPPTKNSTPQTIYNRFFVYPLVKGGNVENRLAKFISGYLYCQFFLDSLPENPHIHEGISEIDFYIEKGSKLFDSARKIKSMES